MNTDRQKAVAAGLLAFAIFGVIFAATPIACSAQQSSAVCSPNVTALMGIYKPLPATETISHAPATTQTPLNRLPLTPSAARAQLVAQHGPDPKDLCQVLGPFRLMARPDTTFEILRDAPNKLIFLFGNNSWGNVRNIRLDADPLPVVPGFRPLWNGDSTATWQNGVLIVDSVHFTDKTWLDEVGVFNSRKLHLVERLHLLHHGEYLEYQATATDPDVLTGAVSYTRYFKRTTDEIKEYNCFDRRPAPADSRP